MFTAREGTVLRFYLAITMLICIVRMKEHICLCLTLHDYFLDWNVRLQFIWASIQTLLIYSNNNNGKCE